MMAYAWRASEPATLPLPGGLHPARAAVAAAILAPAWAAAPVTFAVVSNRAGFDALQADWSDLFRRAGRDAQLFQTFNWNWHWANHYLETAGRRTLAVVTVRRNGRLVMLWPLVAERVAGLKVLRWMGDPVTQYGDVLADPGPELPQLLRQAWDFITHRLNADAIVLRKVRADSVLAPLLAELGLQPTAREAAPYLDLASAPDFAAYEQRYSAKERKNRRRLMRRLQERGQVALERHAGGSAARAGALAAIALKRAALAAAGQPAPAFADPRFAAFFADVADGGAHPAGCGVTLLKSDGETAAVAIDITCGARRATHIVVHDPAFDSCRVGTLLLEQRIKAASAEGIATFDLLAPAYAYKMDWADRTVAVDDFAVGLSLAGRVYAQVYQAVLRRRLKAVVEMLACGFSRLRQGCREAGSRAGT